LYVHDGALSTAASLLAAQEQGRAFCKNVTAIEAVQNMGMLQASQPIVKPTEERKADQGQRASKNRTQAHKGKRMKENLSAKEFTAKDVLKHYKNDRGRAIAKGLALKKQRDLALAAANASKPTKPCTVRMLH
jgi:hypothetical protein